MGHHGIYGGKAKSKRCAFRCFLNVATKMAEWTGSGSLFLRDGAQQWTAFASVLVLILGTNRLSLFDLGQRDGSDAPSMEWRSLRSIRHYLDLGSANCLQLLCCLAVSIIAICVCMVSQTWTSLNFNGFRIDWPALWQSLLHLFVVFHCFVSFIGYRLNLEYCSRSVCWPTRLFVTNSLSIFTPCLLCSSHPVRWDQTGELVCRSPESRPIQVPEHFTLVPLLFGTTCHCPSVQPFQLLLSRNIWRYICLTWPFPHSHQHARWPVDVTELLDRFCCCATEPGPLGILAL